MANNSRIKLLRATSERIQNTNNIYLTSGQPLYITDKNYLTIGGLSDKPVKAQPIITRQVKGWYSDNNTLTKLDSNSSLYGDFYFGSKDTSTIIKGKDNLDIYLGDVKDENKYISLITPTSNQDNNSAYYPIQLNVPTLASSKMQVINVGNYDDFDPDLITSRLLASTIIGGLSRNEYGVGNDLVASYSNYLQVLGKVTFLGSKEDDISQAPLSATFERGVEFKDAVKFDGVANFNQPLNINKSATIYQTLYAKGNIECDNTVKANNFNAVSDKRLKENISLLNISDEELFSLIKSISLYKYNFINNPEPTFGMIAQEVDKYKIDEIKLTSEDEYLSINQNKLICLLWETLKRILLKDERI